MAGIYNIDIVYFTNEAQNEPHFFGPNEYKKFSATNFPKNFDAIANVVRL